MRVCGSRLQHIFQYCPPYKTFSNTSYSPLCHFKMYAHLNCNTFCDNLVYYLFFDSCSLIFMIADVTNFNNNPI